MGIRRNHSTVLAILSIGWLMQACQSAPHEPMTLEEGCNPLLAGADCFLPYPSDVFLVKDDAMPSGQRLEIPASAAIYNTSGDSANVDHAVDGFSKTPPIVTMLDSTISPEGLVGIFDDPEASIQPGNRTLIINAETGELVAHFVDLDPRSQEPQRQAFVIRPIVGLEEQTTYIVAIHGIKDTLGDLIEAPEGFRRLRDDVAKWDDTLVPLMDRYESTIFPMVEAAGVNREDLQLAWDFTTATTAHVMDDVLRARELALEAMKTNPPRIESLTFEDHDSGNAWRTIAGVITAPAVIESAEAGALLLRDENGRVKIDGEISFPFFARIPRSVGESGVPGDVLQFGHGFFGERAEGIGGAVSNIANVTESVVFSIDWWGMCRSDIGLMAAGMSKNLESLMEVTDRMPQTMINWLALTEALSGELAQADAFKHPEGGQLLYNDDNLHFLGISMGAIFGGVYSALNPKIDNVVLHVGAASFSHIMFRANPFEALLFMLEMAVPDPLDQQKVSAMMQSYLDRIDPATFAPYILHEDLPFGPASNRENKKLLIQSGLADTQVPNFASFLHGRLAGVPLLTPTPLEAWGFETVEAPYSGSAMTLFDMGYDQSFSMLANPPESTTPIHNNLRGVPEVIEQMNAMFKQGRVDHPCEFGCGTQSQLVY